MPIRPDRSSPRHRAPSRGLAVQLALLACAACGGQDGPAPVSPTNPEVLAADVRTVIEAQVAVARADPSDASRHGLLGLAYAANDLWAEARASLEIARTLDPDEPLWLLHTAFAQRQLGDREGALASLDDGCRRHPSFAPLHSALGDLWLEQGEPERAREAYEAAERLEPQAAEPLVGLGQIALEEGDAERAVELLERAVALDPGYRAARHQLGSAYREVGRAEDSARELAAGEGGVKRPMPDPAAPHLASFWAGRKRTLVQSQELLRRGRAAAALRLLEPAVQRHPSDARLRLNLGLARLQQGSADVALAELAEAERLDPTFHMIPFNLAAACVSLGRAQEALAHADRALSLSAEFPPAHFVRGRALLALGRSEEARAELEQALRLEPRMAMAHEALGELHLGADRAEDAHAAYLRAAELAAVDSRPWPGIFDYALGQGDLALAQRALETLRRLSPSHPELERMQQLLDDARGR